MDGQQPGSRRDPMKERKEIDEFLTDCLDGKSSECPSRGTAFIFRTMNRRMIEEGNPITPEHKEVLVESFKKGDTLCQTLYKENPHVMLSEGKGPVYRMGRAFHTGIDLTQKKDSKNNP